MNLEEQKIRKAFIDKDWQEIKAQDTWQIFKIMAEFVEGFEKMSFITPLPSVPIQIFFSRSSRNEIT
jgi:hypothetical protein